MISDVWYFPPHALFTDNPRKLPVTEDAPIQPAVSPMAITKQIGEEIIRDTVFANQKLKAVSLRYFNPIGAHPSAIIGELPRGSGKSGSIYNPDGIRVRDELKIFEMIMIHPTDHA
jgi:UDP-glucose 4-epimerase